VEAFNGLKDLGVDRSNFNTFAETDIRDNGNPDFIFAKRPIYRDEIIKIYELAYDYTDFEDKVRGLS